MGFFNAIGLSSGQTSTMDRVLAMDKDESSTTEVPSTEKKYAKLNKPKNQVQQLVYPKNLLDSESGHGHFVLININKITGSMFNSKATKVENEQQVKSPYNQPVVNGSKANSIRKHMSIQHTRTEESIALPMPKELVANYGVIWNARELGVSGQLLRTARNLDNVNLKDVSNALSEESRKLVTGAVQTLTPLNTQDAAELYTGTRSNPFVEVLFNGTTNREHPMQFKFSPKNSDESLTVREIIRRLKFHMYPEFKFKQHDSSYMLHPSIFDLTFMVMRENDGVRNPWLHRMSTCALTNCQVNYTSEGDYTVHGDDAPTQIIVDCTFVELEQLHKGRFEYGDSF
ncbi:baseplate tail tube cap [Vibrio phage K469]